jgi:hypothetical protein
MKGYLHDNYSYRLRYNGLPASLFLSSLEMLLDELTLNSRIFLDSEFLGMM